MHSFPPQAAQGAVSMTTIPSSRLRIACSGQAGTQEGFLQCWHITGMKYVSASGNPPVVEVYVRTQNAPRSTLFSCLHAPMQPRVSMQRSRDTTKPSCVILHTPPGSWA